MYKKSERLAKALHLVAPAFADSPHLHAKVTTLALALVEAAVLSPGRARARLSETLLTISSLLAIAKTANLLSSMNVDLLLREAHSLLQEVTTYEEPRLQLEMSPSIAELEKGVPKGRLQDMSVIKPISGVRQKDTENAVFRKDASGVLDGRIKDRSAAIIDVLKSKGRASIKDIVRVVQGVSEKTIQRELVALVGSGVVLRRGERRWSVYSLA